MLKLFIPIILLFLSIMCTAQGSWYIGYLNVDSINEKHLGKIVRIDFKSNEALTNSDKQRDLRSFVGTEDKGTLIIDGTLLIFAERRKIYVDHGSFNDQYLECINCKNESSFIYNAIILGIDDQTITFQFDIETKRTGMSMIKETKTVRIDRRNLDGIMYRL